MAKRTLVIGASPNPARFAHRAIHVLLEQGYDVIALGIRDGTIAGIPIQKGYPELPYINTVTLYINPEIQRDYFEYLIQLQPERVIFNPGAENQNLAKILTQTGIMVEFACTLVLLQTGNY